MAQIRASVVLVVVLLAGVLTGCTRIAKWQFKRGQKLEARGQLEQALWLYRSALKGLPLSDSHLRSDIYYRLGEVYWRLDRGNEAFDAYEKSVDVDVTNVVAHLRLGEAYLAGGAPESATEQAHSVLHFTGKSLEGLALLGAAANEVGDIQVAEDAFTRVLAADPGRISVAVSLAELYNREDRTDEARAVLRKVSEAQRASAAPDLALGRLEEQEGNVEAAEAAYRRAVENEDTPDTNLSLAHFLERLSRLTEAETYLRRVDALRSSQPTALGDFELASGHPLAAIGEYMNGLRFSAARFRMPMRRSRLLELFSRAGPDRSREQRTSSVARIIEADLQLTRAADERRTAAAGVTAARLHLEQYRRELDAVTAAILEAEIALSDGDWNSAGLYAKTAVMFAPESAPAHYVLGLSKARGGDLAEARREWLEALDKDSSYIPAQLMLATDALQRGDLAGAESLVVNAVREEPGNFQALTLYAQVLSAEGQSSSAAIVARRALVVNEKAAEPHVILGGIALGEGKVGQALAEYEQAILLDTGSQGAIDGLMLVYREGVVTRAVVRRLEAAGESQPPSGALLEIAGRLYAQRGWYRDAKRCFRRALEVDPSRASAAGSLARVFAATGELDAAAESGSRQGGDSGALLTALNAEARHDMAGALLAYETAVRLGDSTGIAANNLAWIYAQQGIKLDRALALAEKAHSAAPDNAAIVDTVGFVLLRRHEYSAAIETLETARELIRRNGSASRGEQTELSRMIRDHLSEAYLRSGQPEQAAMLSGSKPAPSVQFTRRSQAALVH